MRDARYGIRDAQGVFRDEDVHSRWVIFFCLSQRRRDAKEAFKEGERLVPLCVQSRVRFTSRATAVAQGNGTFPLLGASRS